MDDGFAVIPGFLNPAEVEGLKRATKDLVKKYCQDTPISIFWTKHNENKTRDTYFAESGDKIRGFFEEGAVRDGKLVTPGIEQGLNKIGHALHKFEPAFNSVTFSSKVKQLVQKLDIMKKPTVIQSMVIFKQPKVGGIVVPHQDASFMYVEPTQGNLLGLWIALDEATVENGCLHFLPGSHKDGKLHQRYIRNPDKNSNEMFMYRGDRVPVPPKEKLVATPAKPGDLILIDGMVIHQSEPNTSDKPRLAYTFHILEGNAQYSSENWLQPTSEDTFMEL